MCVRYRSSGPVLEYNNQTLIVSQSFWLPDEWCEQLWWFLETPLLGTSHAGAYRKSKPRRLCAIRSRKSGTFELPICEETQHLTVVTLTVTWLHRGGWLWVFQSWVYWSHKPWTTHKGAGKPWGMLNFLLFNV